MLRVGLTGGIGSGKSTVARRLAELGAVVVDSDLLARDVVQPGSPGLAAVVERFGPQVLLPGGTLDRAALGALVFADPDARRALEEITHPRIAARAADIIAASDPRRIVVHDVPLLVERDLARAYHVVVVVGASERVRIDRLVRDRGMSPGEATARLQAQASDDQRRAVADIWLDNDQGQTQLVAAVDRLWSEQLVPLNEALLAAEAMQGETRRR